MVERIEGIVTDVVRHNDRHNVVTLYTRSRGRMAFLVPVGKSKTGRMRNTTFSLLAVIAADVNIVSGRELHTMRKAEPVVLWHGIYSDPVKSSLLFFLTEFCHRLLRQYPADEQLWDFLLNSLSTLDSITPSAANFHIAFLVKLLPLVGIEPSVGRWEPSDRFDMISGEMVGRDNPDFMRRRAFISEEESSFIPLLSRINYRNMTRYRLTADQRNRILDRLLAYYTTHLPIGTEFKTLSVLRSLF